MSFNDEAWAIVVAACLLGLLFALGINKRHKDK
jgi:hypothetical protein